MSSEHPSTRKRTRKTNEENFSEKKQRQDFIQNMKKGHNRRQQWHSLLDHPKYRDDDEVIRTAVTIDGMALEFASHRLQSSPEIVHQAIKRNVNAFQFSSNVLRDDKSFCQSVLAYEFSVSSLTVKLFMHMSQRLRNDKEIVRQAIRIDGDCLEYASGELRADPEVVEEAVTKLGNTLRHASSALRGDKRIVMVAMANRRNLVDNFGRGWGSGANLLSVVSDELRDDEDVVEAALQDRGDEIHYVSERLQNSPKILTIALNNLQMKYDKRVGCVQELIIRDDRCLQLKHRLAKLKSTLKGCKFPKKRCNPSRLTPKSMADRMLDDMVIRKWYIRQILLVHELPIELSDRIFTYTGITTDDPYVIREIRTLGPFLIAGANRFYPRYVSWWVFLTGKSTRWFEATST